MKQNRLSAMSHTAFGLLYFCCFSTTFFWQVSSQEHRPANIRNAHSDDKLSAMYASRGTTNSSPSSNHQGMYRPNSPNQARNVLPDARVQGRVKQDSNPRLLDSSKVGHQRLKNKRVLDSIASDIIKRDMKTEYLRPFAFDVDNHADSNFQDMRRADMHPQSASALPDVFLNYEYSNYPLYDMTPDREVYSPFGHSNEETGFHHNDNPELWYEREYPYAQPQASEHSRMIKFNDTFNHHFINENTDKHGANGGFLDSTAGEMTKKDILDKYEGNTNKARYNSDLSNSFIRNDPNFLDNSFDAYTMESDFQNSNEHTVPSPDMTPFERANGQNYVDRLSQDSHSNKVTQSNSDNLFKQGSYEDNANNDISDSEMEDDLYLLTKGTKYNSHHFEPFFSGKIPAKRYLDGIASSLIKKNDGEKRYLDGIASSLIKKDDGEKRYLDGIASSLIKKRYLDDGGKRYLDGIASSLIKKYDGVKRYLDGIASSLIKKDDGEKRYLDGIASSLIKKDDGEKRYLDGIASSLIKKDDGEKRYLDGIASSLIKKDDGKKRYLDGIASSLIKKDDGEKRYLDGIASSLIKKDDGEKRYLDGIASSLIKKDDGEKRYLDGIASSVIKKDDGEKRYLDGIANSLIKKDDGEKRYLDGIASSLIKKDDGEKHYLDSIAGSVIKKDNHKRYVDDIASSLIKKDTEEGEYYDTFGRFLPKNNQFNTKESSTLINNEGYEVRVPVKRMFEVTDDVMDGSKVVGNGAFKGLHSRRRRDTGILNLEQEVVRDPEVHSVHRQKRFIDGIASSVLYKRFGLDPRSLRYRTTQLAIPSETWAGSQAASNTDPESWKSYPSPALKNYIRDIARRILARSRFAGQRLQPGSKYEIDNSDRDLSDQTNSRWKQKNSNSRDFFDEIAGDLLV